MLRCRKYRQVFAAVYCILMLCPFLSRLLFLCLSVLVFSSCSGLPIEKVELAPVAEVPENAQPSPLGFNKIRYAIPTGTSLISQSVKGAFGLFKCQAPFTEIQGGISGRSFPNDDFRRIFTDTLEGQGYDITGNPGRMFDEAEDIQRSIYSTGARVTDITMDVCHEKSVLFGYSQGLIGEANITIEWSVFDMLNRRTVFKKETKGYAKLNVGNKDGIQLLLENSFASAAHNLGADEEFYNLIFFGENPKDMPESILDINEAPTGLYDPDEAVTLPALKHSLKPAKGRLDDIAKAAVLVQTTGHGSGFFITKEGHILSNAHVVGNAFRVRIVTSGKKEKLKAEVLRVDRRRDVALLKLEEIPEDMKIHPLPIRLDKPDVGETVYAIGSPRLTRLQDTVTSGIVSAHRYNRRERQPYIQADVDIYGGNSGGPLIDENGNVIGISVLGFFVAPETLGGLNWFIPIDDALDKLNITVSEE